MTSRSIVTLAALIITAAAGFCLPALAHHSFGHYDMDKTTEVEGTVHKYEWSNPHCWLFVDVASKESATVTYGFELSSVGEMVRRGWKKTSVAYGEKVKVRFHPMHDGTPGGLMVSTEKEGKIIGATGTGEPPPPYFR